MTRDLVRGVPPAWRVTQHEIPGASADLEAALAYADTLANRGAVV